ncbi:MAG: DUF4469 domain-containing protein [Tannerella sp.]|jgi:hypothetical protein|nr:DUF4469 domain-containing protein [Tannerella sp.]
MAIDFRLTDVIHRIIVKFFPAYLPLAKKKYNAKAVMQTELTIHEIASKAEVYNITTPPKIIEEGFNAAVELITYLVADNYKIKTDLFRLSVRIPGEYDGTETHLPDGIYPEVKITIDDSLRKYVRQNVSIIFDGIEESNGFIGEIIDEATGLIDQVITSDNILTVRGYGLKIESDAAHSQQVGVFIQDDKGNTTLVKAIAQNEPRTLKLLTPANLVPGMEYTILIYTQSPVKGGGTTLKDVREVTSSITLVAQ